MQIGSFEFLASVAHALDIDRLCACSVQPTRKPVVHSILLHMPASWPNMAKAHVANALLAAILFVCSAPGAILFCSARDALPARAPDLALGPPESSQETQVRLLSDYFCVLLVPLDRRGLRQPTYMHA